MDLSSQFNHVIACHINHRFDGYDGIYPIMTNSKTERNKARQLLIKIIRNILKYPEKEKYRDLNLKVIAKQLGAFIDGGI